MDIVWKNIKGYEGKYQISNTGLVLSLCKGKERILKPKINKDGYYSVGLVDFKGKVHTELVHRLVALMFCEKPDGCTVVNHKDENKLNNCADNLEWCTSQYNTQYYVERHYEDAVKRAKHASDVAAEKARLKKGVITP